MAEITVEVRRSAIVVDMVPASGAIIVESGRAAILVEVQPIGIPGVAGASGDPPGTAAALDAAHVAAPDPHPQYQTQAEGDARYSLTGHDHSGVYAPVNHNHAEATALVAGFLAASDKAKIDGIAAGATQNATDAQLRDRATHTGSQAIGTVTGLQAALDAKAGLDVSGKVPASQLPSFVDDVIEAANFAGLPVTGEAGKIYVTLDAGATWRWGGSAYVEISPSPGSTDAVPEGSVNLYHTAGRVTALIAAAVGVTVQAYSATLAALSALTTTVFGRSLLAMANAAALRTALAMPNATTAGRLARYTDAAGSAGETVGIFEAANGNVGVGTSAPAEKLSLLGTPFTGINVFTGTENLDHRIKVGARSVQHWYSTEVAPRATFGYSSDLPGGVPGVTLVYSGLGTIAAMGAGIGAPAVQALSFYTSNGTALTERVRINSAGNVGIGTASPAVALDVNGPMRCKSYTVATVPSAAVAAGQMIYVSNESGGAAMAFSDGSNWRRISDRAVIS